MKRQREGAYGPIIDLEAVAGPWRVYQRTDGRFTVLNRDAHGSPQRYPVFMSEQEACDAAREFNSEMAGKMTVNGGQE